MSLLKGRLNICRIIEEVEVDKKGVYVLSDDYIFEDSDSPSNTYDDVKSPSEVEVTHDTLQEMRSLENLNLIPAGDTLFKCHIAPQAFFPEYKKDEDNILFGCHLFHRHFDGDGKRKPIGANLDWGIEPKFKLEFESVGPDHFYLGTIYFQIYVLITYQNPYMAKAMEGRWREGTKSVGDLQFCSFFFTSNVENCIRYIKIKTEETELRWGEVETLEI
jgi:hypothetical protein